MTLIVALTGGIGSGKTVVSDHFASLKVPVIDTDIIAREIVEPGQPALAQLCDAFGKDILDSSGRLNRKALRTISFSKPENKRLLDSITHPIIRVAMLNKIQQVKFAYCVAVIPLLTKDSPFMAIADRVIAVVADKETKINRVMQRSQLSREETMAIMESQISDQQRLEFADDVIHNDGTIKDAQQAAEKLHESYLSTT
ncbi:UNVERIFIED_CONTAM: hypothetical protein GTU68_044563 [Idotea baltica]|nr:hypothetical protein [Idotea baltica]